MYWFKDGKQILRKNVHYKKIREGDGTCALYIDCTTNDDDGNYTVMAANPQVPLWVSALRTYTYVCGGVHLLILRSFPSPRAGSAARAI